MIELKVTCDRCRAPGGVSPALNQDDNALEGHRHCRKWFGAKVTVGWVFDGHVVSCPDCAREEGKVQGKDDPLDSLVTMYFWHSGWRAGHPGHPLMEAHCALPLWNSLPPANYAEEE
jgi:hypothetical protein